MDWVVDPYFSQQGENCSLLTVNCLFCSDPVIGENNAYVRLIVSGECKDKDSVWETLENKVLTASL